MQDNSFNQLANRAGRFAGRLANSFLKRTINNAGKGIAVILINTIPIWLPILIVTILSIISVDNIYGVTKHITQKPDIPITAKVAAFFGFNESEEFVFENIDLFDKYKDYADKWKDGLNEDQIMQAETHGLSWAILAAVDRLSNDPYIKSTKKIEIKPKEVENVLRPQFEWKTSIITIETTYNWYEEPDEEGKGGGCFSETIIEDKDIYLLTQADTIEGLYTYTYEWETITEHQDGDCGGITTIITAEKISEIQIPKLEELYQPLYEYLKMNNIKKDLDIELALMLAELYDDNLRIFRGMYQNLNWRNYPQLIGVNDWVWPTPSTRITSPYGARIYPRTGFHAGVDIGAITAGIEGDPIWAMTDGIVTVSGLVKGYGITVYIDHGGGLVTRYGHLQRSYVDIGQQVKAGDMIALMGNTGDSTGAHLHFEITIDQVPFDPIFYFYSTINEKEL